LIERVDGGIAQFVRRGVFNRGLAQRIFIQPFKTIHFSHLPLSPTEGGLTKFDLTSIYMYVLLSFIHSFIQVGVVAPAVAPTKAFKPIPRAMTEVEAGANTVPDPNTSWTTLIDRMADILFVTELIRGIQITLENFMRPKVTLNYPFEKV
jgi:hypothetical protein